MKLFAYGCSYTYGTELADHLTTNKSIEKTDRLKKKKGYNKFYETYGFANGIEENKLAYPASIAKTLGMKEYENRAQPGLGTLNMFYRLLQDIQDNLISKDDIIFVGLTSFNRYSWFKPTGHHTAGLPTGGDWPSEDFKKQIILHTSDNDWLLNNIAFTKAIQQITKGYKFFYQTIHWPYTHVCREEKTAPTIFKELENIDTHALLPFRCIFYETPNPNEYERYSHGFGHPFQQYHESFGKKLGEAILEKI